MPIYQYRAVDPAGDVATGELEAANEGEIVDRLRDQGLLPMQVARALGEATVRATTGTSGRRRRWFAPRRVTRDHLLALTRELAPPRGRIFDRFGVELDRVYESSQR